MKNLTTLKSRIIFYFCAYLTVILILFSAALIGMLRLSEDLAFNRQVKEISEEIAATLARNKQLPDDLPMHITAFHGFSNIPKQLQHHVDGSGPGVFEISEGDYHVSIVDMQSQESLLYVFFEVGSIKATEMFESIMLLAIAAIGCIFIFLGWILAKFVSSRILGPISELAHGVQSLSPGDETISYLPYKASDEIGVLTEKINQLLKRTAEFARREREFTSHASHELRTPVTVIKGAVQILKQRSEGNEHESRDPLSRIERGITDIEMLIDTFLLLARQEQTVMVSQQCNLRDIAHSVIESHRYLVAAKEVEITLTESSACTISAPQALVSIALGNLVRNAFQYTRHGIVSIMIKPDTVIISDSGPGIIPDKADKGIGLTIVRRLCERMDWKLQLDENMGGGTVARLIFTASAK